MPVILDKKAQPVVIEMANEILRQHHAKLKLEDDSLIKLSVQMASQASNDDGKKSDEPPLKDGLYAVLGKIKVIPYEQRVDDCADVRITLDEDAWNDMTEPQQRALIDHLLTSLEVVTDDVGAVKLDDAGRPKLRVRACDWFLKGFREIAQRYGDDAPEVIAARLFAERHGDVVLKTEQKLFA